MPPHGPGDGPAAWVIPWQHGYPFGFATGGGDGGSGWPGAGGGRSTDRERELRPSFVTSTLLGWGRFLLSLRGATVDVADAEAVAAWLDPIAAEGVDVLVNLAGSGGPTAPVEAIDPSRSGEDVWRCPCRGSSIAPAGWFPP